MVVVPAGSFTMGAPENEKDRIPLEGPQHVVTIGRAFAAGKLHVTVEQFEAFVRETRHETGWRCHAFAGGIGFWQELTGRSWRRPGFAQERSHPVVCVTWNDAKAYADWLAQKTGKPYRLLSEAEFEYAARGQTSPGDYPRFWFGNDEKALCQNDNVTDQSFGNIVKLWTHVPCDDGYAHTSPVGHYAPNPFGLYDMAGNAMQWTADCAHDGYDGAPDDGTAWTSEDCDLPVSRGGSWGSNPKFLRAAARYWSGVGGGDRIGIRVARTLIP
jgi:formylglycine-generating enzyme required for sulfatase activity